MRSYKDIEEKFKVFNNNIDDLKLVEINEEFLCFQKNGPDIEQRDFRTLFDLLELLKITNYDINTRCVNGEVCIIWIKCDIGEDILK